MEDTHDRWPRCFIGQLTIFPLLQFICNNLSQPCTAKTFADADKLEKALRPNVKEATLPGVCGEAVVVSKLKPRGGNEATEDVKSDALHPELDADADIRYVPVQEYQEQSQ